ncbi:hypothetical protein [Streptomyces sp. NPDC047043]|uniref:hypothetical protein n=1 Tax=Streptomyces sp. NPDC047043 TaxID=3154497 RepID=UPI0033EE11C5
MADDPRTHRASRFRRWMRQPPPRDAVEALTGLLQILGDVAIKIAEKPKPLYLDLLTFDEVVRYFVNERPEEDGVHHGALLAQQGLSGGIPCLQLFVDGDNRPCLSPDGPPYGRYMVAQRLDGELMTMFGGRDLIIFE